MERRRTAFGTPCSPHWSADWIARVEEAEKQIGRPICGGHGYDGEPCTIASIGPSGRCRFHGGAQGTGGQFDNANARIHGLYARRIKRCGPECPLWDSCPMAGDDIAELDPRKRPNCAYEREEYLELLNFYFKANPVGPEDLLDPDSDEEYPEGQSDESESPDVLHTRSQAPALEHPPEELRVDLPEPTLLDEDIRLEFPDLRSVPEPYLLHQMIVLQLMVSRAAATLASTPLTDRVEVDTQNYRMKTAKPGAALEAFIRLSREYRCLRSVIDTKKLLPVPQSKGIGSRMQPFASKYGHAIEKAIQEVQKAEIERLKEEYRKNPNMPSRTEGGLVLDV